MPGDDRKGESAASRQIEIVTHALRVLLQEIVDYAGLFPPAGLEMRAAVANYADYRAGPDAWALGRFVVPLNRMDELMSVRGALATASGDEWCLSALVNGNVATELAKVQAFNGRAVGAARIDAIELKLDQPEEIATAGRAVQGECNTFVEVPVRKDPATLVQAIAEAGLNAKIRTGGTTADSFPTAAEVTRFMRRCSEAGVAFKATAGLHHPLRGSYRLTYANDAACSTMFGFLNVFLAAAALREGARDGEIHAILECDAQFATFEDAGVKLPSRYVSAANLGLTRQQFAIAFGSCSFAEPMDEMRELGLR